MRVLEGGETPLFKSYFATWATSDDQAAMGIIDKSNIGMRFRFFFSSKIVIEFLFF